MTTLTYLAAQRAAGPRPTVLRRFANCDIVCQGWYAIGAARSIRPGRVVPASIGNRDIVVYRERDGVLRAMDRVCPHLGADLAQGAVVDKGLQCAFHRWCWAPDGACGAGGGVAAGARISTYAV